MLWNETEEIYKIQTIKGPVIYTKEFGLDPGK